MTDAVWMLVLVTGRMVMPMNGYKKAFPVTSGQTKITTETAAGEDEKSLVQESLWRLMTSPSLTTATTTIPRRRENPKGNKENETQHTRY